MTLPSLAPEAGRGPRSTAAAASHSAQPLEAHSTNTTNTNNQSRSSAPSVAGDSRAFHANRPTRSLSLRSLSSPQNTASASATSPSSAPDGRAVASPTIRSFHSPGPRKSAPVLDMHPQRASEDSCNDECTEAEQRDRALRALEGRAEGGGDFAHVNPRESGELTATTDNDNTADIFMRIAGEDTARQTTDDEPPPAEPGAISRIIRTVHRRPLSAAVPSHQATSPPQISRRLSDQRDHVRTRLAGDTQRAQHITRELTSRTASREDLPPIATSLEGSGGAQSARPSLKPSPVTPKHNAFKDSFTDISSAHQRRRQSLSETNLLSSGRTPQYRSSHLSLAQGRSYSSSPLVPRLANAHKDESHHGSETNHGVEGTESSASTAAASTVWDELDDLKSRIHRLELTGKLPPKSGASTSRSSDDRPPTATTNATTVSASPKRGSGSGRSLADWSSNASFTRETQPLLLSALGKTKHLVRSDIFHAIESAATDALALSAMMGAPGQPGPISSAASSIGYSGGVTDRQLRRKADSICRSLTELCIALADEADRQKQRQATSTTHENQLLMSPTSAKGTANRRSSIFAEPITKPNGSPRAMTTLEQRRQSMLASSALPSPRYAAASATPLESNSSGRKSSLLLSRLRRAGTEDPEEASGRRSSLLLRMRRARTEEPDGDDEGRRTSLYLHSRNSVAEEEEVETRLRGPTRSTIEVSAFRASTRDLVSNVQSPTDGTPLSSSALPRRRLAPSSLVPRLVTSIPSTPGTPARRYLERSLPRGEPMDRSPEDRSGHQRQYQPSQTLIVKRTGSLSRRNRESGIPSLLSPQNAQATAGREGGGYR